MEIERKWLVNGWPEDLPVLYEQEMRQGYVSVRPTVRIREEAMTGGSTEWILCFKSSGTLARKEIEISISREKYEELVDLIGYPMIRKVRRTYRLPDGAHLEVSHVDEGEATEFWYAEIEFETEREALLWEPNEELRAYLDREVTMEPGESMGAYWVRTRLG